METEIKLGDVVVLKSGGQKMTAVRYPKLGDSAICDNDVVKEFVECVWTNSEGVYRQVLFPVIALKLAE